MAQQLERLHVAGATDLPEAVAIALDDLPEGVVVLDRLGRIEAVNAAFWKMTRRAPSEVLHVLLEAVVAEEDMLHLAGFEAVFASGAVQDLCMIFTASDGERRPLIVCANESRDGTRIVLTARPAGAVQRELADTSRWAAVEQERAIASADARDVLAGRNAALGAARDDLQVAYVKLEGEMAARERLENELVLAQKLEAIGQLSAGVAHEINTPMQYVGNNVDFMIRAFRSVSEYLSTVDAALDDPQSWNALPATLVAMRKRLRLDYLAQQTPKALQGAKEGVEHVSRIVAALKSFSHLDGDTMAPGDINRALMDTLTVAQNEYKDVADVQTDLGELPAVCCFVGKLRQVFLNLVVNAAHAIIDAGRTKRGTIRITSRAVEGAVEIAFGDDGCGIPDAVRARIFDPFFTTKEVGRGSGQGLYLARRIVIEIHAGALTCESIAGVGTTFIVRLPVDGEMLRTPTEPAPR